MSTSNEFQTLARVTTEIDESEVKLTYAKQCIKAQEDLSNKLKAEIQRRKEVCNFQKNANLILEAEVQNAEHEIKSLITTHNAITSANTQTKRELLLAKEYNMRLVERMKNAEKKYENIWTECKKRYEGIPIVKKLMETTKKLKTVQVDIKVLDNEMTVLNSEFKIKKAELVNKDRKQIIQMVQFIVHEIPVARRIIKEKSMETRDLKIQIDSILKEQETNHNKILVGNCSNKNLDRLNLHQYEDNNKVENWAIIKKYDDDTLVMPRLQLPNFELDITSVKLEINKVGFQIAPVKRTMSANEMETETNPVKRGKDSDLINNYLSCYFNRSNENVVDKPNQKPEDFSKRKLINILEDVKLDEQETYKIITKVNMDKCQDVRIITAENVRNNSPPKPAKVVTPLESEEIEEIDISNTTDGSVLVPPSEFLDLSQVKGLGGYQQDVDVIVHVSVEATSPKDGNLSQIKTSQEDVVKKRVSFDIPMAVQVTDEITPDNKGNQTNDTIVSQLDLSIERGDNFSSVKDMILKKHNLDLSPQFVYGKNMMMPQKKTDDKLVTSKFFESKTQYIETDEVIMENNGEEVNKLGPKETSSNEKPRSELYGIPQEGNLKSMEDANGGLCSKVNKIEEPVAGLLFTHGPQGIPDCLDISMSTTGYEEGDSDFPTGLDSSLLMSPKADTSANCVEVGSQEVPNFLSGFRKAGLSFFKQNAPSGNNSDSSKQNQQDIFSFNFSSEDKKNKGGIFSFFR